MTTPTVSTPRNYFPGFSDISKREPVVELAKLGSMIVHVMGFAEQGWLEPTLVNASGLTTLYGSRTSDPTSPYGTHTTVLLEAIKKAGGTVLFQRMKPADATSPASIRFSLEYIEDTWDTPSRDVNGNVIYDASGKPVPVEAGVQTTTGYTMRWLTETLPNEYVLGQGTTQQGTLEGTGTNSTILPIFELPVSSFGSHGNFKGVSIYAPTIDGTADALKESLVSDLDAMLFRMKFWSKDPVSGSVNVIKTRNGADSVNFAITESFVDPETNVSYSWDDAIYPKYDGSTENPPVPATFGKGHLYRNNWNTIAELVYAKEASMSLLTSVDMVNLISAKTVTGAEYYSVRVLGTGGGGVMMTRNAKHYAGGGSDGTMGDAAIDALVANQLNNYLTGDYPFHDMAKYPFNVYCDSGFSVSTKKLFGIPMGARPDVYVVTGTQDATAVQNTMDEDASIGVTVATALRSYPESELNGTSACRGFVVAGSGRWKETSYKGILPLSIDLIGKMTAFAGGWSFDNSKTYDAPENKTITGWKDINIKYLPNTTQDDLWNAGVIVPAWYDTSSLYYPAVQSIYSSANSVFNNPAMIQAASVVVRECAAAHRAYSGNFSYTPSQLGAKMDETIIENCNLSRFANKVSVTPTTGQTAADTVAGWATTSVLMKANIMHTADTFEISGDRFEG